MWMYAVGSFVFGAGVAWAIMQWWVWKLKDRIMDMEREAADSLELIDTYRSDANLHRTLCHKIMQVVRECAGSVNGQAKAES